VSLSLLNAVVLLLAFGCWNDETSDGESVDSDTDADTDADTDTDTDTDVDTCPEEQIWNGDFTIDDVVDIEDLAGYTMVTGYLRIEIPNETLTPESLDGLQCLETVGLGLYIHSPHLPSLFGLSRLAVVGEDLIISDYTGDLHGMENLTTVGRWLEINNVEAATDLSGLESLVEVGEWLRVFYCDSLQSLSGLDNLQTVPAVILVGNPSITSLDGLDSIEGNLEALQIDENASLEDLSGLEWINAIECSLSLFGNPNLTTLAGLENLSWVGLVIDITYNDSLSGLDALNNLEEILPSECPAASDTDTDTDTDVDTDADWMLGYLDIEDNPALPTCDAEEVAQRLVENGFAGEIKIENNLEDECSDL